MMKRTLLWILAIIVALLAIVFIHHAEAQQPQVTGAPPQALQGYNSKWANGVAPGYYPTCAASACSSLSIHIGPGTCFDSTGTRHAYAGANVGIAASSTTYFYLDSSCTVSISTTSYGITTTSGNTPIATVVSTGSAVTSITDDRTFFKPVLFLSTIPCSMMPALTGDVTSLSGTCGTTLVNIPDGTTMAGKIVATNIAAPSTPASGKTNIYVDSTAKMLAAKNDAGLIGYTVIDSTSVSHNFVTSIVGGVVTKAQPAFSDLSGSATTGQLPGSGVTTINSVSCTIGGSCTVTLVRGISLTIGDPAATSALTSGSTTTDYVTVPFGCTISAYNLLVDAGTITVKFWKIATGTAIPTSGNSINTSGVAISSGTAIHSTTLSDFTTTTITANDIVAMNVTAVSTAKYVNGVLQCQ